VRVSFYYVATSVHELLTSVTGSASKAEVCTSSRVHGLPDEGVDGSISCAKSGNFGAGVQLIGGIICTGGCVGSGCGVGDAIIGGFIGTGHVSHIGGRGGSTIGASGSGSGSGRTAGDGAGIGRGSGRVSSFGVGSGSATSALLPACRSRAIQVFAATIPSTGSSDAL